MQADGGQGAPSKWHVWKMCREMMMQVAWLCKFMLPAVAMVSTDVVGAGVDGAYTAAGYRRVEPVA